MRTIFLDFETYYDKEYSLSKMTPAEYILDPRYETIGCAIKEGLDGKAYWRDGDQLQSFFDGLASGDVETRLVSHNALFDMCIVAWRFGYVPTQMVDTLGVARATMGHELALGGSLANVAKLLGLGAKTGTLAKVLGMDLRAIKAAGLHAEFVSYGLNDVELCAGIYRKLVASGLFPAQELETMDMVLRCAIEPRFILDQTRLSEHLAHVRAKKESLLATTGVEKKDLMSAEKFAQALRDVGVEPATKLTPKGNIGYAFAKTDQFMMDLEESPNFIVQALAAARLGFKSTLEETRCERFLKIGRLAWPGNLAGNMPIPLRYSGAHTHRLSGDWRLNLQNLPKDGELRRALLAPPGYAVVAGDASQIEARIVAWLSEEGFLLKAFRDGQDVYSMFASHIYGRKITRADKQERFLGKVCILGMGYGVGWEKYRNTVKALSRSQLGTQIDLNETTARHHVSSYRNLFQNITRKWKQLENHIPVLASGGGPGERPGPAGDYEIPDGIEIGPVTLYRGSIVLPSGLRLFYKDLRMVAGGWEYTYGKLANKRLYGGALMENITQALARIIVMDAAVRIQRRMAKHNIRLALQVHDELVYIVPVQIAELFKRLVLEEMTKAPDWAPDLPLAAEVGSGPSYGDAK